MSPAAGLVNDEKESCFTTDNWERPENSHSNGFHRLKCGIEKRFDTLLQCIMPTSAMRVEFFERITSQSNNYARKDVKLRRGSIFIGHKWTNILSGEMIRFFGIILIISLHLR